MEVGCRRSVGEKEVRHRMGQSWEKVRLAPSWVSIYGRRHRRAEGREGGKGGKVERKKG